MFKFSQEMDLWAVKMRVKIITLLQLVNKYQVSGVYTDSLSLN